jgi:hypothetical protein
MQHDSNVQTTQQGINNEFPKKLISDLWDNNVFFENILFIPGLLAASVESVSEQYQDFLEDAYHDCTRTQLLEQCPELESVLEEIRNNDDIRSYAVELANDFYNACGEFEFLIQISIRIPYNFKFDEKGTYRSNSLGGSFQLKWILAKNMIEAAQTAVDLAEKLHNEKEQEALKEQGFEG